ncbi:MAG: hypothetical protein JKX95_04045 [Bacteroidia bacterium]|nr:hypothetical protein [Bacteroidia bacterium]
MKTLKNSIWLRQIFLLAILAMLGSSCKIMYKPNMMNVPLFKEKGEIVANVGVKNFQGAYAVTENIGVMVNGYYDKGGWEASTSDTTFGTSLTQYTTKRSLIEGGAGYFKSINDQIVAEVFVGGGLGQSSWDLSGYENGAPVGTPNVYTASYLKIFAQPSVGIKQDIVDFIFTTRFVFLKFSNIETNYSQSQLVFENLDGIEVPSYLFLEPALTLRVGYKWVKFHMQMGYSAKLTNDDLNTQTLMFNTALHFDIAKRFNQ